MEHFKVMLTMPWPHQGMMLTMPSNNPIHKTTQHSAESGEFALIKSQLLQAMA
jgi:hypothetical protein